MIKYVPSVKKNAHGMANPGPALLRLEQWSSVGLYAGTIHMHCYFPLLPKFRIIPIWQPC